MNTCTFFGHHDCPDTIKSKLRDSLITLIAEKGVECFLVGHNGNFDAIVYSVLHELKQIYPHISFSVVFAYMPTTQTENKYGFDTILPEGIEAVPKRFAISWRNKWMLKHSDYVVTYVSHSYGNAAKFAELAKKKNKYIIAI